MLGLCLQFQPVSPEFKPFYIDILGVQDSSLLINSQKFRVREKIGCENHDHIASLDAAGPISHGK